MYHNVTQQSCDSNMSLKSESVMHDTRSVKHYETQVHGTIGVTNMYITTPQYVKIGN